MLAFILSASCVPQHMTPEVQAQRKPDSKKTSDKAVRTCTPVARLATQWFWRIGDYKKIPASPSYVSFSKSPSPRRWQCRPLKSLGGYQKGKLFCCFLFSSSSQSLCGGEKCQGKIKGNKNLDFHSSGDYCCLLCLYTSRCSANASKENWFNL